MRHCWPDYPGCTLQNGVFLTLEESGVCCAAPRVGQAFRCCRSSVRRVRACVSWSILVQHHEEMPGAGSPPARAELLPWPEGQWGVHGVAPRAGPCCLQGAVWGIDAVFHTDSVSTSRLGTWGDASRKVVESPSLEIFKTRLDKVLCSLLWVTLLWQGVWTRWPTEVPSNPEHSVICDFHQAQATFSKVYDISAIFWQSTAFREALWCWVSFWR